MQKDGVKLISLASISIGTSLHIGTLGHMLSNRSLSSAPFTTASLLHYTQFLSLCEGGVWWWKSTFFCLRCEAQFTTVCKVSQSKGVRAFVQLGTSWSFSAVRPGILFVPISWLVTVLGSATEKSMWWHTALRKNSYLWPSCQLYHVWVKGIQIKGPRIWTPTRSINS